MAIPLITLGQPNKLNKNAKIGTLLVFLQFADTVDSKLKDELSTRFDSIVIDFNKRKTSFKIKVDSSHHANSINFIMGEIRYVNWKKNLWITGLDVAMVGANILIFPYFPPVIPFYLMPATFCKVRMDCSPELIKKPKLIINPNGYFTKVDKQKIRFKKKFNRVFSRFFFDIQKQYAKNNMPV